MTPQMPAGFAARPPRPDDVAAVTAVIAAGERDAHGVVDIVEEDVRSDWRRPSFDLAADAIVVTADSGVVAYAEELAGRAHVWVHPSVTGLGIGTALLGWTEDHAQRTGAPDVGQTLSEHQGAARRLLSARGYVTGWVSWIFQLPLDRAAPAPAPPGIRLRGLRRPDDERTAYEVIEAAFAPWPGRRPVPFDDWVAAHLDRRDADPDLVILAEDAGRVVGAAVSLVYDDEGWVEQLAVAASHRGRGVGRALLGAAFAEFRRRGLRTAGLSTDSRTGARGLYEQVGMQVLRSYTRFTRTLLRQP